MVTYKNIHDIGGYVTPNGSSSFFAYVVTRGFMRADLWNNIAGADIASLTANPAYPVVIDQSLILSNADWNPLDAHSSYGLRFYGYFTPPALGINTYKFYVLNDDGFDFWLSSDSTVANLNQYLAAATPNNAPFHETGNGYVTIPLGSGTNYLMMVRLKQNAGTHFVRMAVKLATDLTDPSLLSPMPGSMLSSFADPSLAGNIGITQQPQPVSARENDLVSFNVVATNTFGYPQGYQWYLGTNTATNTVIWFPIAGANSDTYTTNYVASTWNNRQFRVDVSVPGKVITSQATTLTVAADTTPPSSASPKIPRWPTRCPSCASGSPNPCGGSGCWAR